MCFAATSVFGTSSEARRRSWISAMSVRESGPRPVSGVRITAPAVINAAARSERFKHLPRSARRCRSGFLNPARITKLTPRSYVNAEQTEAVLGLSLAGLDLSRWLLGHRFHLVM